MDLKKTALLSLFAFNSIRLIWHCPLPQAFRRRPSKGDACPMFLPKMLRISRNRSGIVTCVALAIGLWVVLNYAAENPSTEASKPGRIIFPPASAKVPAGKVVIIGEDCGRPVVVDRSSRLWEYSRHGIGAFEIELKPGKHLLRIGGTQHEITVVEESGATSNENSSNNPKGTTEGSNSASDQDDLVRWHPMKPMAESCEACHRMSDMPAGGVWPRVPTPDPCLSCHGPVQLEAIHAHPMEHLHHCQDCHHMHAAPYKHLLTKPIRELCSTCHQS